MYTLSAIWIYPVKSLGGIRVPATRVLGKGLEFDRRWMLVDSEGQFLTQRTLPLLSQFHVSKVEGGFRVSYQGEAMDFPTQAKGGEPFRATVWDDVVTVREVEAELSAWFFHLNLKSIFNLFGSNSPPLAAYNRKMSEYIHKSHNVSVLLYHLVFPAKYRKAVFDEQVDSLLKEVCLEMEKRYEIKFVEIGVDKDHVHFLVQSVPTYSVTRIVTMIKSITGREIFKKCPQVKKQLWGGEFWSDGYYASTVGKHGDEGMIARYVKEQDKEYLQLHQNLQLSLF